MATPKTTAAVITVAALVLASIAAYMVYNFLSTKEKEAAAQKAGVQQVVVAAVQIPFGAKVQVTQLKVVDWPKANLPAGTKSDPKALEGRMVTAMIPANSPVLESSLAPIQAGTGVMSYLIPEGHRAVTVAVNDVVGVAGFVLPNSIVDVVATVTPPSGSKDTRLSKIVLQNIKVLATGQIIEQKEGKPVTSPTVTLDVTPEQAEKLIIASENRVQLILKHLGDTAEVKTTGATVSTLLAGYAPARPAAGRPVARRAKAAPAERPVPGIKVEVIKGNAKTTQEFK